MPWAACTMCRACAAASKSMWRPAPPGPATHNAQREQMEFACMCPADRTALLTLTSLSAHLTRQRVPLPGQRAQATMQAQSWLKSLWACRCRRPNLCFVYGSCQQQLTISKHKGTWAAHQRRCLPLPPGPPYLPPGPPVWLVEKMPSHMAGACKQLRCSIINWSVGCYARAP